MKTGVRIVVPIHAGVLMLAALYVVTVASSVPAVDRGQVMLSLLARMQESYDAVNDYVAVFHKQERVDGQLLPEEKILLKFQKPLRVYMKWIGEPLHGTEALYVEGKYNNEVLAHRGGILGVVTLSLDPRGAVAMKGNRHPITEVGFGFLIREMRRNIEKAVQAGDFEMLQMVDDDFHGRPATLIESRLVPGRGGKYYASRMICHIDKELTLPVGVVFYDEKNTLIEKYSYTDVKLNAGLGAMDFSRYNEAYKF